MTHGCHPSQQGLPYLGMALLLAVDGGQEAIAFQAFLVLFHDVSGHLFSFPGLTHHGQDLCLQNHMDMGSANSLTAPRPTSSCKGDAQRMLPARRLSLQAVAHSGVCMTTAHGVRLLTLDLSQKAEK